MFSRFRLAYTPSGTAAAITLFALSGFVPASGQTVPSEPSPGFYLGGGHAHTNVYSWEEDDDYDEWDYGGDTDYGDGDSGFTVTTGYRFSPGFAIEASYTDSGTPQWDEGAVFITSLGDTFDVSADIDMTSTQVSLVGLVPFGDNWDFYVRGGIVFWDAESKQRLRRVSDSELITRTIDEDGEEFVLGIGMGVTVRESWYLRADYAVFEIDDEVLALAFDEDANARILSFQLIYRFGQRGPTSGPLQTPRTER